MQYRPINGRIKLFSYRNEKIEYMNELSTPGLTGNWKAYTQITINKLPRLSQALYELIKGTDTKTEMTAYYAYAYS